MTQPLDSVALFRASRAELGDVRTVFTRQELSQPPTPVAWPLVVSLRRRAAQEITNRVHLATEAGQAPTEEDRRQLGNSVIRSVVRDHANQLSYAGEELWSAAEEDAYIAALSDAIFGYGRLQPLFNIPQAENIELNGHDSVMVQYPDGRRVRHPPVADSDTELIDAIRFLGEQATPSRPFDDAHPTMTLAIGDRFRLHAIGFGLTHRPSITIRQHTLTEITLDELAAGQVMPPTVAEFLRLAVLARKSMIISGDQGAGKTTLLRAMVNAISPTERFGTLETDYELLTHLRPGRHNVVAMQARVGLGEQLDGQRLGEVTVADLMPEALRQNLSRIVVGEVRGGEAGAMFEAMAAGTGTISTTHSHSAASTMDRLASRVAQGGVVKIDEAYRQIAHNVTLLIHVQLLDETWRGGTRHRYISEIRQLTGAIEGDRPATHLTWLARSNGIDQAGFTPDPALMAELATYRANSSVPAAESTR